MSESFSLLVSVAPKGIKLVDSRGVGLCLLLAAAMKNILHAFPVVLSGGTVQSSYNEREGRLQKAAAVEASSGSPLPVLLLLLLR